MIMSKSLKTILDFSVNADGSGSGEEVITVHPDVVSIICKKYKFLDYSSIQRVAKDAKLNSSFTTKKKEYRKQYIYSYGAYKIVFASNHTTIVEMQCNVH